MSPDTGAESGGMGAAGKIAIVAVLAVGIGAVVYLKSQRRPAPPDSQKAAVTAPGNAKTPATPAEKAEKPKAALPKLLELGSTTCTPCKMMDKVLDQLRKEYAGKLEVEFQDVMVDRSIGRAWEIQTIPTQIFLDPTGNELFRHEGFFSKDDVVAKWKELGFDLDAKPGAEGKTGESKQDK